VIFPPFFLNVEEEINQSIFVALFLATQSLVSLFCMLLRRAQAYVCRLRRSRQGKMRRELVPKGRKKWHRTNDDERLTSTSSVVRRGQEAERAPTTFDALSNDTVFSIFASLLVEPEFSESQQPGKRRRAPPRPAGGAEHAQAGLSSFFLIFFCTGPLQHSALCFFSTLRLFRKREKKINGREKKEKIKKSKSQK